MKSMPQSRIIASHYVMRYSDNQTFAKLNEFRKARLPAEADH